MTSQLIDDLLEEHRLIERLLASLLRVTAQAKPGDLVTKPAILQHVEAFRELLDAVHHGREEDILFEAMCAAGFPSEQGPVAVMLSEHERGRALVGSLRDVASTVGPLTGSELNCVKTSATSFAQLLSAHINKEDNILYPMAIQRLGAAAIRAVDAEARAWQERNPKRREQWIAQAQQLVCTYLEVDSPQQMAG